MGNSLWRLQTTLNYVAEEVSALGRMDDVEVVVTDWGSERPLREVLQLTPAATRIVSFLLVPPDLARQLQKDSPFPEVLALNAAARRVSGHYIGRIDQDTLVGRLFLETFFELVENKRELEVPLNTALLFSNVRMVPYRFAVRCLSLNATKQYISRFGSKLQIEKTSHSPFYHHSVGIWLLPTAIWHECGGYNEDMLYMNAMEITMIQRLLGKYKIIDLGKLINFDFYHLEHYHPWVPRRSSVYRKTNDISGRTFEFNPNGNNWGLRMHLLSVSRQIPPPDSASVSQQEWASLDRLRFSLLLMRTSALTAIDSVPIWRKVADFGLRWKRRKHKARMAIKGHSPNKWPRILLDLWKSRGTRPAI
jgi:hypothetical protein